MPLKYRVTKTAFDLLPDIIRAEYTPNPDKADEFILSVDGAVDKNRLDEFRNTNIELQRKIEAVKDVDPKKYRELVEQQRKINEKELLEAGDVDKIVEGRVGTMKTEYETKIAGLTGNMDTMSRQLESLTIDNVVRDQATKLGVQPTAVDDVLLRAKTVYRLEEGRPVPKTGDGQTIYGKDGSNPMPISEYIVNLKETAPHLFQGSSGSGANGNQGGGRGVDDSKLSSAQKIAKGLADGSSPAFQ